LKISEKTKISALISENKDAITVIASINRHFEKLKNPFLRKVLGTRVNIKDAARIGGTTPEIILEKLRAIGFEVENIPEKQAPDTEERAEEEMPVWAKGPIRLTLDVREQIARGKDPMKKILSASKEIDTGEVFLLINSFEPFPIISLLKEKGFVHYLLRKEKQLVYTYLKKTEKGHASPEKVKNFFLLNEEDFKKKVADSGNKMEKIDVRELEMPGPMVSILEKTEGMPGGNSLYVKHKKVPMYLLPELQKRNFNVYGFQVDENNIDLIIIKNKDART